MREIISLPRAGNGPSCPVWALVVNTRTGERLLRAVSNVLGENDPSSHRELRTVRLACHKLKSFNLSGYTM